MIDLEIRGKLRLKMSKRKISDVNENLRPALKKHKSNCSQIRVSATKTRNYLMNDPLLDWLELYGGSQGFIKKKSTLLQKLFSDGIKFEDKIVAEIFNRFPHDYRIIKRGSFAKRIEETKKAISGGIPIIYQGVVENSRNNSFGIPDLIVRVDFLNRLMNQEIVPDVRLREDSRYAASYCIIDIKNSTLHLSKDRTIYNQIRMRPYKGQVIIYNEALAEMQNYTAPYCYILGKRTIISKKSYGPFEYLGVVDVTGKDKGIISLCDKAIKWYQELKNNGISWNIWQPNRWELTPNMCNQVEEWQIVKYRIAYHQGELTLLWKVSFSEKMKLWGSGLRSWRNRRFTPNMLKASEKRVEYKELLEQALNVNRTDRNDILPLNITKRVNSFPEWRNKDILEFYIDFETAGDYIFLIGMGYTSKPTGRWQFEYFVADKLNAAGEGQVMRQWLDRLKRLRDRHKDIRLIHWTHAERSNYDKALMRHNIRDINVIWVDLYKFFVEVPISVRGSFTYSLKDVAWSLYETGNIETVWQDDMNGLAAAKMAQEVEEMRQFRLIDVPSMSKIVDYNEIDCKVLWEILQCIRNKL